MARCQQRRSDAEARARSSTGVVCSCPLCRTDYIRVHSNYRGAAVTDEQVLEAVSERNKNRDKVLQLRTAIMGVIACFKSRVNGCDDTGCIEDHHPSCLAYLENTRDKVDGKGLYAGLEEETSCSKDT